MIINHPEPDKKTVDEYVFTFRDGVALPVSIDATLGDKISFTESHISISLSEKPSIVDSSLTLPASELKIYTRHLLTAEKITRDLVQLTFQQQEEWQKTLKQLSVQ